MRLRYLIGAGLAGLAVGVVPALAADQTVGTATGDNAFTPSSVAVRPGETVTFTNSGMGFHNVVFEDNGQKIGAAGTGDPSPTAWSGTRTFATPGSYRFYCQVHGGPGGVGMSGIVYVNDAGTVPSGTATTAPEPTTTTPGSTTTPRDTTPPALSSLRAPGGPFCARRSAKCRRPGVALRAVVSERGSVTGTLRRRAPGARTYARFGSVRLAAHAGANNLRFLKTSSGRRLAPGDYRLTARAVDSAGNRSAARTVAFRVRA